MNTTLLVLALALVVTAFSCLLFVFHSEYEVGVLGVIGLGTIAVVALSRLESMIDDPENVYLSPRAVLMWVGVALFFGQLAWRFLKRLRCRDGGWRCGRTGRVA